jgi:hypothetical protein
MSLLPLTQIATYWTINSVDGNNTKTWNAGIALKVRWVIEDGVIKDERGNDQKTEWIVYATTLIPKRSMVVLEDLDGTLTPPDGARELVDNVNNPSLTNLKKHVL